jgi:hypothetical protein
MNPDFPEAPPAPRKRRGWLLLAVLVGVPVCALAGALIYLPLAAERAYQAAVAEADRLDPDWRLADVEAQRALVPQEENSALQVLKVHSLIPRPWPDPPEDPYLFTELPAQARLNEPQAAALRQELAAAAAALAEARKLEGMPRGRFIINYSPDFISTVLPHVQEVREVAGLLQADVRLRAEDGDADGAVASTAATLNTARSLGDEPTLISQLVRIACTSITLNELERTLAQGEPAPDALAGLQRQLEANEGDPLLLYGVRGERGGGDQLIGVLQRGGMTMQTLSGLTAGGPGEPADVVAMLPLRLPGGVKHQRAAYLRYTTRLVETARRPSTELPGALAELEKSSRQEAILVRLLAPAVTKVGEAFLRNQAQQRCAIVALAAERFRRAQDRWPASAAELQTAGFLKAVPTDPFDGRPVRLAARPDGLIAYSVGPDGEDNGGLVDPRNWRAQGTDLGFRLWDVAQRRQEPLPPRPAEPAFPPGGPGDAPGADPGPPAGK